MAWLHAWSGLVVGWVLFAVFATGTASYCRAEITRWMQPELSAGPGLDREATGQEATGREAMGHEAIAASVDHAVAYLQTHAQAARAWFVTPPRPGRPVVELFWRNPPGTAPGHVLLDPRTGAPARVRDTQGGDFLWQFHFELHMAPLWGRWIVGLCAMIMLVALLSGIVTHRRIVADLFTFRPGKAPRRSWLDAHNVAGVLALPYHLMIAYTGLVVLALTYMPWGVRAAYDGDAQALFAESGQIVRPRPPAGRPGTLAPVAPMVRQALAAFPQPLERVAIRNPRDANATVVALFEAPRGLSHESPQIAFDGVSGGLLETSRGDLRPATRAVAALIGLHEAHFAGAALRAVFFLCGVMGCAMVATGLVLWSAARLPPPGERPAFGLRLVRALTVGGVAGLSAAIAAYFLANRLLPLDAAGRAEWEVRVFFAVWIAMALVPLVRPPRRAWCEGLAAVSILWLAVAVADLLTLPGHPLRRPGGDPLFVWFDGAMLTLAALFALAARTVAGHARPPAGPGRAAAVRA